jgi:SAM-dependent methyltransferase
MRPSVDELQAFYRSRRGQLARRLIATQLRALWPDVQGLTVVGIGFATPFFPALDRAARTIALMPAGQGASRGNGAGPSPVALVEEEELPLADGIADRILLVHSIETAPRLKRLFREVWRVLADGGRLAVVVPNRRGFWCWNDTTPFGSGQPYSQSQMAALLEHHLFEAVQITGALYLPPALARLWPRLAIPSERLGRQFLTRLSGVVIAEAQKSLLTGRPLVVPSAVRLRRYAPLPQPAMNRGGAAVPIAARERSGGARPA